MLGVAQPSPLGSLCEGVGFHDLGKSIVSVAGVTFSLLSLLL